MTFIDLENRSRSAKVKQVGSIDHRTILLNLIEIGLVVFFKPRSQDLYMAAGSIGTCTFSEQKSEKKIKVFVITEL
jgi:hypothetical protein